MGNCHPKETNVNLGFASVDISFLGVIHLLPGNIDRCQVVVMVRAWFHDSADDINFHQMFLSQLKASIFHVSTCIIYMVTYIRGFFLEKVATEKFNVYL